MSSLRNLQDSAASPTQRDTRRLPLGGRDFSDKVMTRVRAEPRPTPARAFTRSLMALAPRDAAAALGTAWRLGFRRTHSAPPLRGLQSLTVIVVVLAIVGIGGPLAASGTLNALGLIQRPQTPLPGGTSPAFIEVAAEASPDIKSVEASPQARNDSPAKQQKAGSRQKADAKQPAIKKQSSTKQQQTTTKRKASRKRHQVRETPKPRVRATPEPRDDDDRGDDDSSEPDPDEEEDPED